MECLKAVPTPSSSRLEDDIYFPPSERELERRDEERLEKLDAKDPDYDPSLDKMKNKSLGKCFYALDVILMI